MTEINLADLAAKVLNAEPLTDAERETAATLLKFSGTIGAAIEAARHYGAVATMAGYRAGESSEDGHTPTFFVMACDDPDPETWAAIQAALDEHDD